jgi:hypothetical protein
VGTNWSPSWRREPLYAAAGALIMVAALATGVRAASMDVTVRAPASLTVMAERVRTIEWPPLEEALVRAGLEPPPRVRVTLVAEDDPDARATPSWIVGQAFGPLDVVVFPARVGAYPYSSLESVLWHEVVHLALSVQARGQPLPRWFHEGVAMSIERGWGFTSQVRLGLAAAGEPGLADLGRLFNSNAEPEAARAYLLASTLIADLRQQHGAAAPGAIVGLVAQGIPFSRAFEMHTGETQEAAAARVWRLYQGWTSWIPVVTGASALWIAILGLAAVAFVASRGRRRRRRKQWDEEELEPRGGRDG